MSVFNDSEFLPAAVESVLKQTFADFEFLVVDDGSTDGSSQYLNSLRDPRVRLVRQETNQGLTRSLQRGLGLAEGRYVARIDADDVAFADRLERQVAFLEHRPEVVLLGGGWAQVNEAGDVVRVLRQPERDLEIRWSSLLVNPFVHSTVMVRHDVLREHGLNYDEVFQTAQDYDLWSRLLRLGQGANLPGPLIYYRLRSGITGTRREQQLAHAVSIAHRTIRAELPDFAIERQQVEALCGALVEMGTGNSSSRAVWAQQLARYRELLAVFAKKHRDHADWRQVRHNFGTTVLRSAWCRRFPPGWVGIVASALAEDPSAGIRLAMNRLRAGLERRRLSATQQVGKPAPRSLQLRV
jgi:glycosyltransferase involved in cell wall biosynthesis